MRAAFLTQAHIFYGRDIETLHSPMKNQLIHWTPAQLVAMSRSLEQGIGGSGYSQSRKRQRSVQQLLTLSAAKVSLFQ